jgi:hypothetical protein
MKIIWRWSLLFSVALVFVPYSAAAAGTEVPLKNWAAPPYWTASSATPGRTALVDISGPLPFVPVVPCRVADTRTGSGFSGQYGPPSIVALATRTFTIGGQCGIPNQAAAVSFLITAVNESAAGNFRAWPDGSPMPTVGAAVLVWSATAGQIANGIVVPVGGSPGVLDIYLNGPSGSHTDLVLDVNGYYSTTPANQNNFFQIYTNSNGYAIYAKNSSTTCSGPCGIVGIALSGYGVEGRSNNAYGVYGESLTGGDGVFGTSDDGTGAGVHGYVSSNVSSAASHAVFGEHASTGSLGFGVEGFHAGSGVGVYGHTTGSGTGVYGYSAGIGVVGYGAGATASSFGVYGQTASTASRAAGVVGFDGTGTHDENNIRSAGVRGYGAIGVVGSSSYTYGYGVAGTFNNPSTGYSIASGGLAPNFGGTTYGVYSFGDFGATGAKYFVEPHPTDASLVIRYGALEGPESGTYFRGTSKTVRGAAVIDVPESFRMVTDEEGLTVQLTPVGGWAEIYIESQDLDRIVVRSSKDVTFHYLVQGVRKAFKDFVPIAKGQEFMPRSEKDRMPGYLTEVAKRRLIANGTYNPDGTVNMATAEREGWAERWREEEQLLQQAQRREVLQAPSQLAPGNQR